MPRYDRANQVANMKFFFGFFVIGGLTWLVFFYLERKRVVSERLLALIPVALTTAMIIWSAAVSPYSNYGDLWAAIPVLVIVPVIVAWHISLLTIRRGERTRRRKILAYYGI